MNILQPDRSGSSSVIRTLIIINVIAYVLLLIASDYAGNQPMKLLALHNWLSTDFKPWQIITHLFLHSTGGVFHLFFNMLALWMFGSALEQTWGAKRFTYYYFACGIGAALVHNTVVGFQLQPMIDAADLYLSNPSYTLFEQFISNHLPGSYDNAQINDFLVAWYNDRLNPGYITQSQVFVNDVVEFRTNIPTVGASGAVYGLLLAFGMTFPNAMILMLIPPIPMKAKYFVIVYGLIELSMGLRNSIEDNVAHFAHLGGMVFGILLIFYYKKLDRNKFRQF
jgi:membrane associated rhomboid family serine protease